MVPARIATIAMMLGAFGLTAPAAGAATINVGATSDNVEQDGLCSLREAIEIANTNDPSVEPSCTVIGELGDDVIRLGTGEFRLSIHGPPEAGNASGDLRAIVGDGNDLTIRGNGPAATWIVGDGDWQDRVLGIEGDGGTVRIEGVGISGGNAAGPDGDGGGILVEGPSAVLEGVTVEGNDAGGSGGGIHVSSGALSVFGSTISENRDGLAGGVAGEHGAGGIGVEDGFLAVVGSTISDNIGDGPAGTGGGGVSFAGEVGHLAATVVRGNEAASGAGGGISVHSGTMRLNGGTRATGNSAIGEVAEGGAALVAAGGELIGQGAVIQGNVAAGEELAQGAGVRNLGTLTLTSGRVAGNRAETSEPDARILGAGIANGGEGTILAATIEANRGQGEGAHLMGAGIANVAEDGPAILRVSRTLVRGNRGQGGVASALGGGLATVEEGDEEEATATSHLINTTVTGNDLTGADDASGGAVAAEGGVTSIRLSTLARNTLPAAGTGPAIGVHGGVVRLRGSILDAGGAGCHQEDPGGIDSDGFNVDRGSSCANHADDIVNSDPRLMGLRPNGGPTDTHAIPLASPATRLVPVAECIDESANPVRGDQRGFRRPFGGACDAGGYEVVFPCFGHGATIIGSASSDIIGGTPGPDVIWTGGGDNTVRASGGNDRICGGPGRNRIDFSNAPRGVRVNLGEQLATGMGLDRLAGIQDAIGSRFSDVLIGDPRSNALFGGAGNDRILGRGGNDRLFGGRGRDRLFGGRGRDRLFGGPGNDRLFGGPGRDILRGGRGRDLCVGGRGRNRLLSCELRRRGGKRGGRRR